MKKKVLLITLGDPGGIGPEVAFKALRQRKIPSALSCVLIGPGEALRVHQSLRIVPLERFTRDAALPGRIHFFDITPQTKRLYPKYFSAVNPGRTAAGNGAYAYTALLEAAHALRAHQAEAVVTAPVSKEAIRLIAPDFIGHTEFFARAARVKKYAMMFIGRHLKVTLVTIHVPLKKVSSRIRAGIVFDKIALTHEVLKKRFGVPKPRIAVCSLNPHGRETGNEESLQIEPAVRRAQKAGMLAMGPYSADQIFFEALQGRYDAVVSMYHDQGLAPFKMIHFRDGVNMTAGLPFVRTSPDHGTAFDMAGKGQADPGSMQAAVDLAVRLVRP